MKTAACHTNFLSLLANFLSLLERAARLELAASALGLRRSVLLSYARDLGVTGENRTLVDWVTASRLNHSATVTKKNLQTLHTFVAPQSISLRGAELGGPPGNRTPISCLQSRLLPVGSERPELWSGVRESNSLDWFGRPGHNQYANPA